MKCPHCGFGVASEGAARCPRCGRSLPAASAGVVRTSAVRVSAGGSDRVYSSADELPAELQRQLDRALHGPHAETFVIADERGREQLFEVVKGLPSHLQKKVLAAWRLAAAHPAPPRLSGRWRAALALAAGALVIALLWFVWRV